MWNDLLFITDNWIIFTFLSRPSTWVPPNVLSTIRSPTKSIPQTQRTLGETATPTISEANEWQNRGIWPLSSIGETKVRTILSSKINFFRFFQESLFSLYLIHFIFVVIFEHLHNGRNFFIYSKQKQ